MHFTLISTILLSAISVQAICNDSESAVVNVGSNKECCKFGQILDSSANCAAAPACPPKFVLNERGTCCGEDQYLNPHGECDTRESTLNAATQAYQASIASFVVKQLLMSRNNIAGIPNVPVATSAVPVNPAISTTASTITSGANTAVAGSTSAGSTTVGGMPAPVGGVPVGPVGSGPIVNSTIGSNKTSTTNASLGLNIGFGFIAALVMRLL